MVSPAPPGCVGTEVAIQFLLLLFFGPVDAMIAMMATLATLTFASRRLEMIRENVEQGRCCSPSEVEAIAALGGPMAETYGEITLDGMKALANRVMMGPSDIFADLGSVQAWHL